MATTTFSGPVVSTNGFSGPAELTTEEGAGISNGTGTSITFKRSKLGNVITTHIFIDITGLTASTTLGDIIGVDGAGAAYLCALAAADVGQVFGGSMTCLEVPTTGINDIDLYAADEATGVEDTAVADLTETQIVDAAGAWTLGETIALTAFPTAGQYLYLTVGLAGTPGLYDAGQFLIEILGYEA